MNQSLRAMRSIVLFFAATQIAGAAEYLFSPRIMPVSAEGDTEPTFILKEEDKKKIPGGYWSIKGEDDLFRFRDWLLKTHPTEELTIKMMRRELYSKEKASNHGGI